MEQVRAPNPSNPVYPPTPPYPPYVGPYPLNPNLIRGGKPLLNNGLQYHIRNGAQKPVSIPSYPPSSVSSNSSLLMPALLGSAGALLLGLFPDVKCIAERLGGSGVFQLAIVGYAAGATFAISLYLYETLDKADDTNVHVHHIAYPFGLAVFTAILLFSADFFFLYRLCPSSFQGYVGDNLFTQIFSFIYLSITTITTAGSDIAPISLSARALASMEMLFFLFILTLGLQLFTQFHN